MSLEKRTYVYVQRPKEYEISGCECGNDDPEWSEYKSHLWCERCQKDFLPASNGLFDGPIGIEMCKMLGIYFDTIDLATGKLIPFEQRTEW